MRYGPHPMLLSSTQQIVLSMSASTDNPMLLILLSTFEDVFQAPSSLPPTRLQDHRIPLIDEAKVVKVRPYQYHTIQKAKIEKLAQEMM